MRIQLIRVFICLLALAVLTPAQNSLGSIEGVLVDPNGAVISNAKVSATRKGGSDDKKSYVTTSDESGVFTFSNLPYGVYELEFKINWSETPFKKQVEVKRENPIQTNIEFALEPCSDENSKDTLTAVTDEDKAEIVRQMLSMLLEKHSGLLDKNQSNSKLVLSTKNLKSEWLTAKEKQRFDLLSPSEIQNRADTSKDFLYLVFSILEARGKCVAVSLDNVWAVGKNSDKVYLSGGGNTYEFRKLDGRWVAKYVVGWVS